MLPVRSCIITTKSSCSPEPSFALVLGETSYASDRPEIVYCEMCYQQEVI